MLVLFFDMSRPTRARGLKQSLACVRPASDAVAPHAGAWIETSLKMYIFPAPTVAPHAGAWIETFGVRYNGTRLLVAPHAGAWIET